MSQNLQNFAKFQNFQLENLVDFEKCCKTRIDLQKSVPIQPKTGLHLPKGLNNIRQMGSKQALGTMATSLSKIVEASWVNSHQKAMLTSLLQTNSEDSDSDEDLSLSAQPQGTVVS